MKYKQILLRIFHLHPAADPFPKDGLGTAQELRTIISGDLHDIIAPGLLLIHMQAQEMTINASPEDILSYRQAVLRTSEELVRYSREMIWSLNPRNGQLDNVVNFISECFLYRMASSILEAHIYYPDFVPDITLPLPVMRCLIKCLKEAADFLVRNSEGTQADMHIMVTEERIRIRLNDNNDVGNLSESERRRVLASIEQKIKTAGGSCSIFSAPSGTHVWFQVPFPNN